MKRVLRQAQTVSPYGVGAVFDVNGESLVAADSSSWAGKGETVSSPRLSSALGGAVLTAAPVDETDNPYSSGWGVPFIRFPQWLFCKACRRMVHWHKDREQQDRAPVCGRCAGRVQLVPMRVVQACAAGHLEDIDWHWFAHLGTDAASPERCAVQTELHFETFENAASSGLDSVGVRCAHCGAFRPLTGITARDSLTNLGFRCHGTHPWATGNREPCDESPRAIQRGASNLYYPTVWTSIEVPSDDADVSHTSAAEHIRRTNQFQAIVLLVSGGEAIDGPVVATLVQQLVAQVSMSSDFILGVIRGTVQTGQASVDASDLLTSEWSALNAPDGVQSDDFSSRPVALRSTGKQQEPIAESAAELISSVVLIDRLREVRVLEGFHRLVPGPTETFVRADGRRRGTPLSPGTSLPATEVFGEGIFLRLSSDRLSSWETDARVVDRIEWLQSSMTQSHLGEYLRRATGPVATPRFVLLHSLGHLLMRRLAFESGYGFSSLRERLYARSAADGSPTMGGVLIYTAAGDSEGTLGGLVRQGEPPDFLRILIETITDAGWCSSDPLCGEQVNAGFDGLSHAACHACVFASETSCECANHLLDRLTVIGNAKTPGFFDGLAASTNAEAARLVIS